MVRRGEVWWAEDPASGRRPYLVLTRDAAIPVVNALLVAPATRTVRGIATEVPLDVDHGMPEPCALSLDNTTLMPRAFLRERICALDVPTMHRVCRALAIATGCAA